MHNRDALTPFCQTVSQVLTNTLNYCVSRVHIVRPDVTWSHSISLHPNPVEFSLMAIRLLHRFEFVICIGLLEDIVEKGDNTGYQHYLLFPQCPQNLSYLGINYAKVESVEQDPTARIAGRSCSTISLQ